MADLIERTLLAGVPALLVRPAAIRERAPTVLWYHGFGADKDTHLPELRRFANAGLLAVGVDAVDHGERRAAAADLAQGTARSAADSERAFELLVGGTVAEVPALIDALLERGTTDGERIAVAGVSMGACIVYGAIPRDRRIRAAVALLGSPERNSLDDAGPEVARFFPTALLSITAGRDSIVPPAAARALHCRLAPFYDRAPDRLSYVTIPGAPHFMCAKDWEDAIGETCEWLCRFAKE
ncbi:dienelactone hydrolase family protein [Accumulibacter sp.]|uniref:alpha/beta hydrolase family protein n=1 Tax=Accumulibacter sp. TaxID=2053492 RepID=UPI00262168EC|nr:dienelactone hydrolase family protein [Accumulibacter sp.]